MEYLLNNSDVVAGLVGQHLVMTLVALAAAVAIALPLGFLIARYRGLAGPVMGILGALYTVPSIALMILLIPLFGLNSKTVIVALVIYAQIILVRNTVAGLDQIDPAILEAARGMGMNGWQTWWRVQFPLAFPLIVAGMRIAAVVVVAIATLGAKFGAGGLGTLLFDGIAQGRMDKIWLGTIFVALLAFGLNGGLLGIQRQVVKGG